MAILGHRCQKTVRWLYIVNSALGESPYYWGHFETRLTFLWNQPFPHFVQDDLHFSFPKKSLTFSMDGGYSREVGG